MKRRLLTGTVGLAVRVLTAPADARLLFEDGDRAVSQPYEPPETRRSDERTYPPDRRRGRQTGRPKGRRDTPPRRRPTNDVAARSMTSHARMGGSRGCLTTQARALLERIEGQFGPVQVISTCRPGARIRGTGRISRHASGNAIDFNAGARKAEMLRWLIANHKAGGIMTYAGMSHVHVDIGYPFVALNSGGRRR